MHQRTAHPGHGRRTTGELWPSGPAAGCGTHGICALDALSATQPGQSVMVQSRPFRPLGWAWLDAALRLAVPHRLRALPGRTHTLPTVGHPYSRPPGKGTDARTGAEHLAAPAGLCQWVGPGEC